MLDKEKKYVPYYGNLIKLNTTRLILDSISEETLEGIVDTYLDIIHSSSAIYEANGDYAVGIFSSGWCRILDQASRRLCDTDDNRKALDSGKWLCHESCWTDASKVCIEKKEEVDIECNGGIRLYAVPILSKERVLGAINFGYGDPPKDSEKIEKIAKKYNADPEELKKASEEYIPRSDTEIEMAKRQLKIIARLLGDVIEEMSKRKLAEKKLLEKIEELEHYNRLFEDRELRMIELKDKIKELEGKLGCK